MQYTRNTDSYTWPSNVTLTLSQNDWPISVVHCRSKLHIRSKFHENPSKNVRDMERILNKGSNIWPSSVTLAQEQTNGWSGKIKVCVCHLFTNQVSSSSFKKNYVITWSSFIVGRQTGRPTNRRMGHGRRADL